MFAPWLLLVLTGAGCSGQAARDRSGPAHRDSHVRPFIAASVYPLSFLVREAVGKNADVADLTKPGFEPHDAELTAGQVRSISRADLVVYLGGHFQPVVERAVAGLGERAEDLLPAALDPGPSEGEHRDGGGTQIHSAGDERPHLHEDPHVWLDPRRMRAMNRHIAQRLAGIDPGGAPAILSRAADTDRQLAGLDRSFARALTNCSRRDFMTGHGAFGYLAERYGLEQITIGAGFSESEPSPGRLARLALRAKAMGIQTVFYERSTSPGSARTLAHEIGANVAALDSIETAPPSGDYLSAMHRNLVSLTRALECK